MPLLFVFTIALSRKIATAAVTSKKPRSAERPILSENVALVAASTVNACTPSPAASMVPSKKILPAATVVISIPAGSPVIVVSELKVTLADVAVTSPAVKMPVLPVNSTFPVEIMSPRAAIVSANVSAFKVTIPPLVVVMD